MITEVFMIFVFSGVGGGVHTVASATRNGSERESRVQKTEIQRASDTCMQKPW